MLGRSNPIVQRIRDLRRSPSRRDAEGVFLAEGAHLAEEALASSAAIEIAVVSPRIRKGAEGLALLSRLERAGVRWEETTEETLDRLQDARSPQPIVLVVRQRRVAVEEILDGGSAPLLLVVAHGIQDPGNLGSIVRSSDAAGATGLVATGKGADLLHPRTVRATMGSIFRLAAAECELERLLSLLAARGVRKVGSEPGRGHDYSRFDLSSPTALFLGPEGAGLPSPLLERMDETVRIPMREGVNSLSVAAAAAVLLFEARRQRGAPDREESTAG